MNLFALLLTLSGAVAVDGDTFKIQGDKYRVWGIDAPEDGDPGSFEATIAMRRMIAGQTLLCEEMDVDRYGRSVVLCLLPDGKDLACEMVRQGHAVDWPKYSGGYYENYEVCDR